jgi:hypothetical protein
MGNKAIGDGGNPTGMGIIQSATGHQKVYMGAKLLIPAKGMDDRHNPRQVAISGVPIPECLVGCFKKHLKVPGFPDFEVIPEF